MAYNNGCFIGGTNSVYPHGTKTYYQNSNVEYFQNVDPIHVRYYDGDPLCGILQNKLSNQGKQCIVNGKWGSVMKYHVQDNSCGQQVNVPLDSSIMLIIAIVLVSIFGYIKIKRK